MALGPGRRRRRRKFPVAGLIRVAVVTAFIYLTWYQSTDFINVLGLAAIWGIATVGLGLVLGAAGQISLCQASFVLVGAYMYGTVASQWSGPTIVGLVASMGAGALAALLVSPILRARGYYLAIATMAVALLIDRIAVTASWIPGGNAGLIGVPTLKIFGYSVDTERRLSDRRGHSARSQHHGPACPLRPRPDAARDPSVAPRRGPTGRLRRPLLSAQARGVHRRRAVGRSCRRPVCRRLRLRQQPGLWPGRILRVGARCVHRGQGRLLGAALGALIYQASFVVLGNGLVDYRFALLGVITVVTVHFFPRGLMPSLEDFKGWVPDLRRKSGQSADRAHHELDASSRSHSVFAVSPNASALSLPSTTSRSRSGPAA